MAFVLPNNTQETSITTGTGALTLAGAVTGHFAFNSTMSNGDTTIVTITDGTDMEVIKTTFTAPSTLARAADADVLYSTNGNNRVNWTTGTRNVYVGPVGELYASLHDPDAVAGLVTRTAERTYAARTLAVTGSNFLSWNNNAGTTGNPTLNLILGTADARYAAHVRQARSSASTALGTLQTVAFATGFGAAGACHITARVELHLDDNETVTLRLREDTSTGTILDELFVGADTASLVRLGATLLGVFRSTGSLSSKSFVLTGTGTMTQLRERIMTAVFFPYSS